MEMGFVGNRVVEDGVEQRLGLHEMGLHEMGSPDMGLSINGGHDWVCKRWGLQR